LSLLAPYDSDANYLLLKTWIDNKETFMAQEHYKWLVSILIEEYDTSIPLKIKELFDALE
jgi:hypothetical protein